MASISIEFLIRSHKGGLFSNSTPQFLRTPLEKRAIQLVTLFNLLATPIFIKTPGCELKPLMHSSFVLLRTSCHFTSDKNATLRVIIKMPYFYLKY